MINTAGEYNFGFMEGDTYNGFSATLTTKLTTDAEPTPVDLTASTIEMRIQSIDKTRRRKEDLTTYNGKIDITDGVNGKFEIVKQKIKLEAGIYEYSLQIKFSDGDKITYLIGNCEILSNSTSKKY